MLHGVKRPGGTPYNVLYGNASVADPGIQGRGPGLPPPPLIFRPNWGPKGRIIFETAPPPLPSPLSQGLDDRASHLSEGLDPPLCSARKGYLFQASGIWKGRDFNSWSISKVKEIGHFGLEKAQQGCKVLNSRYVKGIPFVNRRYTKGVLFLSEWHVKQARNQDFMWGVLTRPKWTKLPKCIFYCLIRLFRKVAIHEKL